MDVITQLGELALGSRLKRLSDKIMRDGANIYIKHGIDLEPRWFPVYYLLSKNPSLGVMEVAEELNMTHPSVSQIVKEMKKQGLITSVKDSADKRKSLLSLSEKGMKMLPAIKPVWKDIASGIHEVLSGHKNSIIGAIEEVEKSLMQEKTLDIWVNDVTSQRLMDEVEIIDYKSGYKELFRDLNYEWIKKYFKIEDYDREVLENPGTKIIKKGGYIFFARLDGKIIGTCALMKTDDSTYELAKMAVTQKAKGRQVGKKLGLVCIEKARKLGAQKIFLESNKSLTPAITLYRRLGFIEARKKDAASIYERANIYMELEL